MLDWRLDIDAAPRGTVIDNRKLDDDGKSRGGRLKFVPDWILVSVVDAGTNKVSATYRSQPTKQYPEGRWSGLSDTQQPHAWAPWPEPHPVPAGAPIVEANEEDDFKW